MSAVIRPSLAQVGHALAEPVSGAQQVFRAVLEAMSRPGRVQTLPAPVLQGLQPPGLGRALTAVLLSLLDAEVGAWIEPSMGEPQAMDYLRFHTGARHAPRPEEADFVVLPAAQAAPGLWARLRHGSDAAPQGGATLVVEVPSLEAGATGLVLRGPGIADVHRLQVGGLSAAFWQARRSLQDAFPRGVDLVLCCGDALAALPRTTRVAWEG